MANELNEKYYQRMPLELEKFDNFVFNNKKYVLNIKNINERITPPIEFDGDANYFCKGNLALSSLEKGWRIEGLVAMGFCLVPRDYDFLNTEKASQEFAEYVFHELKYRKKIWVNQESLREFIYNALAPFRKRKKKLISLVEGVDFGDLEE